MLNTCGITSSMYWKCWSEDENLVLSPKIGGRLTIKSILNIFEFQKTNIEPLTELRFRREARCRFFEIQNI